MKLAMSVFILLTLILILICKNFFTEKLTKHFHIRTGLFAIVKPISLLAGKKNLAKLLKRHCKVYLE